MLTSGIKFTNFKKKIKISNIKQKLLLIIKEKNQIIQSLTKNYKNSFTKKKNK